MSILQEILDWTKGLPEWQSDAVARLLAKQTLTIEDQDDLFALLKAAHGITDPKDRKPKPLTLWRKRKLHRRIGYWGPARV